MRVQENRFRASQVCRILGSPIACALTLLLLDSGPLTLSKLVRHSRRSKQTTCYHLSRLRLVHLVRYETLGSETRYWIKYPDEVRRLVQALEGFVSRATRGLAEDA